MADPYVLKSSTGAAIVVEAAGLRSIGGAELNYLSNVKHFDVVNVTSESEWTMAMNARVQSVDVVGD